MLQEMRKFAKSWVSNIFLGLLTLSFVTWGVGDLVSGRTDTAVAKVGSTGIDQEEFRRDYTNALRQAGEERGGKPLSTEEARRLGIGDALLQQDISQTALDNVIRKLGLTVSDATVTGEIHNYSAFAGLTGQFDRNVFQERIQRIGYTEQGFIERVRGDLSRNQLLLAVEGNFIVPPGYARMLFAYFTEVRAADYIVIDAKTLGAIPPPPDTVLAAYVKAHPNSFSTPEYRDVTYAWIGSGDVASRVTITDAQIKAAYEENLDHYVVPEKRDLEQIRFKSQADAQAASAKIAAGSKFGQIAAANGGKPEPIGELVAADLDAAQSKVVFALPPDGVSPPLKAASGQWVLFHVVKIAAGSTKSLDEAKDEIKQALVLEQAQSKLTDVSNAYTDASSSGLSLLEAAKKSGMHSTRIAAMDNKGLDPSGAKTQAPDDAEFRAMVFRAEPGEDGDPQPTKAGVYYVVSVNGSTPPKLKPLDQVRAQALEAWTAEQRAILLKKKAQELAAQANREHSLDGIAKLIGAKVTASPALSHTSNDAVFSAPLLDSLFQATPGSAVVGPKGNSGEYVVARLTGIFHPPLPLESPNLRGAVRQISQGVAGGITESFVAQQRAQQGVKINEKLLNSVLGSAEAS
jgi:peptidyl-prolyl cis-trans isomerase D